MKPRTFSKSVLPLAFCFVLAAAALADTLIESFDSTDGWTVEATAGTASIAQETTIKNEGAASLKLIYNYTANPYYEARLLKTFSTPVDLSEAIAYSLDIYSDAPAPDQLLWYIMLHTTSGKFYRYVYSTDIGPAAWTTYNFTLRDMEHYPWDTTGDAPDLAHVDQIALRVQMRANVSAAGTANIYFDHLRFRTADDDVDLVTLDDFESYADDAALQAAWALTLDSGGGSFSAVRTTQAAQGAAAMQIDYSVAASWYAFYATKTLDTPLNTANVDFFRVRVYGDAAVPAGKAPQMYLCLVDAEGNWTRAWMSKGLKTAEWTTYIFFANFGGEDAHMASPAFVFEEDKWDTGGGTCNRNAVQKVMLKFEENSGTAGAYNLSVRVDSIEYGRAPVPTHTESAWTLYE